MKININSTKSRAFNALVIFSSILFFWACQKKDLHQIQQNVGKSPLGETASGSDDPTPNGRYIIEPALGKSLNDVSADATAAGATVVRVQKELNFIVVSSSSPTFAATMSAKSNVGSVTTSYTVKFTPNVNATQFSSTGVTPKSAWVNSNTFFGYQWGHTAINTPAAWSAGYKGRGARVAVCDGGFFPNHPDIDDNVNMTLSKNFVAGEALEMAFPGFSHGTHCAGIIAAEDNDFGVVGVAPEAQLVLVKVLSDEGSGSFEDVVAGIIYSADCGADIISLSLGGYIPKNWNEPGDHQTKDIRALVNWVNKAVKYATNKGSAVFCAAANDGIQPSKYGYIVTPVGSPGSFGISATAPRGWAANPSTNLDEFASYSNYGIDIVDFSASGGDFTAYPASNWWWDMVLSTSNTNGYYWAAGTSMACPQAAGVGALIIGKYGKMSPTQLKAKLVQSCDDLGKKGRDELYGHGRVNAYNAVK